MPKLLNFIMRVYSHDFMFPKGRYILNFDNTERKRSAIFFFCFRTASLDGSGLKQTYIQPYNSKDLAASVSMEVFLHDVTLM